MAEMKSMKNIVATPQYNALRPDCTKAIRQDERKLRAEVRRSDFPPLTIGQISIEAANAVYYLRPPNGRALMSLGLGLSVNEFG